MMKKEDSYDTAKIITPKMACDSALEVGDAKERLHMCEICGMRFGLLENLNRHRMIHTDQRPFPCTYCTKRFRLAQHLKEHIRIHTGEKPYKCPTCGRAFCQISNLKSHQKTHTKIKAFKCDICDKCFRRAFTLKQHKLTHVKRSVHSNVWAAPDKDIPQSVYHTIGGKQSAPARRISSESAMHQRHFLNHAIPNMVTGISCAFDESIDFYTHLQFLQASDGRFIASSPPRGPMGEFQVASEVSQTAVPPSSAPARITHGFVESAGAVALDEKGHRDAPSEISQCPSLSALLRTDYDARSNTVPSMKNEASSVGSNYYKTARKATINDVENSTTCGNRSRDQQARLGEFGQDYYGASDYSCVQCFRRFSNQMELRNHAITDHNRKNRRRDSAYSSHSDKSPTQSPSLAAVPFRQTSDVPPVALSKSHFTEVSFMKRVKELALISLGRYNDRQEAPTTRLTLDEKERITSNQRSDLDKRTRTISLEVGHSPTETTEETKVEEVTRRDSSHRDDDIKSSRRGFCASKKWKRELCKEWYEVPHQSNLKEKSLNAKEKSLDVDCEMDGPKPKHLKEDDYNVSEKKSPTDDEKCSVEDHIEISAKTDNNQKSFSVANFNRFAPIVEWKPVVTGWKDMVCGTLYALPPHAQHSYLQSMYDPRLLYSKPSSTESSDSHHTEEENPDNETSPRYFRFSPQSLASFPIDAESAPNSVGDSALPGVYSYVYPPEALPLSGYSRLQHALLQNWDPNRQRLGGTSSVPQTPNLISAT